MAVLIWYDPNREAPEEIRILDLFRNLLTATATATAAEAQDVFFTNSSWLEKLAKRLHKIVS